MNFSRKLIVILLSIGFVSALAIPARAADCPPTDFQILARQFKTMPVEEIHKLLIFPFTHKTYDKGNPAPVVDITYPTAEDAERRRVAADIREIFAEAPKAQLKIRHIGERQKILIVIPPVEKIEIDGMTASLGGHFEFTFLWENCRWRLKAETAVMEMAIF